MRYLADTHILIWAQNDPSRLSAAVARVLRDSASDVAFSPVSLWEIAIKFGLGKLDLLGHTPEEFLLGIVASGMPCLPVTDEIYASSYRLPRHHRDPFDRLLYWQAIKEGLTLLSADTTTDLYRPEGLVVVH